MNQPFKAKVESICPYCGSLIRKGDECRYNKVFGLMHASCADQAIKDLARYMSMGNY